MSRESHLRRRARLAVWLAVGLISMPWAASALETRRSATAQTFEPRDLATGSEAQGVGRGDVWFVVRTGFADGSSFRLVETVLKRGRWIQVDVGYVDFGDAGEYRKLWLGGGGAVVARPRVRLELKAAVSRSFGTAPNGEQAVESNAYLTARPHARWSVEISHSESFPLGGTAIRQSFLDRARLEYGVGGFQLGAGWAGYRSERQPWDDRPFVSISRPVPRLGEVEVWLQQIHGSTARLQLRLARKLTP